MGRPARTKRSAKLLDRLSHNDITYFRYGFAFFQPYDDSDIPRKWELAREEYMKKWLTFQPFDFGGDTIRENKPGTRPWAWWNLDHPKYRRKISNAEGFEFSDKFSFGYPSGWSGKGDPEIESQAAFLKRKGLLNQTEKDFFKQNEMELTEKH